jgi:ribose 5-phosphate isomerase A
VSTSAEHALGMIADGAVIGLGTGRAATEFIHALGRRVQAGLRVRGVPTSQASADLARQLGVPLTTLDEVESLDAAFDGADEVDPNGDLIKGYGGALVREKIVAASAKKFVVLVGPEKLVPKLGARGKLPVEVVPFGVALVRRKLHALGLDVEVRQHDGKPFVTDNGNHILDARVAGLERPEGLEREVVALPGVVGTGLFIGMANTVLVQHPDRVEERKFGL